MLHMEVYFENGNRLMTNWGGLDFFVVTPTMSPKRHDTAITGRFAWTLKETHNRTLNCEKVILSSSKTKQKK